MASAVRIVARGFVQAFPGALPGPRMTRRWWRETGSHGGFKSFQARLLREVMALQPELPRSDFRSVRAVQDKINKARSYASRKNAGCCPFCGTTKDPLDSHTLFCERCRCRKQLAAQAIAPRRRQSLRARVALGSCVNHPTREAVPGRTLCAVCLEALVEATIRWRDRKRAEALALGDCSTCFKRPARSGQLTCQHCADRAALRKARAKNRQARPTPHQVAA